MNDHKENPFILPEPAVISFSGGRTSAYMLYCILKAYGGRLPDNVVVAFQNTGREMPATLNFIRDCETHWGIKIYWLEFCLNDGNYSFRIVDYESASRSGEPFDALLSTKKVLPNAVARFCTIELKLRTMKRFIMATKGWNRWYNVVGIRADEPKRYERAMKGNAQKRDRWQSYCPLYLAGVTEEDVLAFWRKQPFNLQIAGKWEGNCDGCFLKADAALIRMFQDHPERMQWWISKERPELLDEGAGCVFKLRTTYRKLFERAQTTPRISQDRVMFASLMEADPECGNSCEPIHDQPDQP